MLTASNLTQLLRNIKFFVKFCTAQSTKACIAKKAICPFIWHFWHNYIFEIFEITFANVINTFHVCHPYLPGRHNT